MYIEYQPYKPQKRARAIIKLADDICRDYQQRGYSLTLRQLFYQFVARGYLPNSDKTYSDLSVIINKARLGGLIDWNHVEDRTRSLRGLPQWDNPGSVIKSAASSYHNDLWLDQDLRIEVWVEKEALAGIVQAAAQRYDCSWFSCRGYVSQSEMWAAGQRLFRYIENGQRVLILHLGDHDPSGIDMTRDIRERLTMFIARNYDPWVGDNNDKSEVESYFYEGADEDRMYWLGDNHLNVSGDPFEVRRIALNMGQINQYQPPPNPAKLSDGRAKDYIARYGQQSWELDALDPAVLEALIVDEIVQEFDPAKYTAAEARQEQDRDLLLKTSSRWDSDVRALVEGLADI